MTTLPSPPLSPVDAPYNSPKLMTSPNKQGQRKEHQRHPGRRRDTFELLQALVIEHQRLEQQEYETMLREALPSISCRAPAIPPKGILINSSSSNNGTKCSSLQLPSTENTKKAEMTFNTSLPSSRDNNHSCPTIPLPPSIPAIAPSASPAPRRSLSRIAFALPPPISPSSSSLSSTSISSPSPISSSQSSPSSTTHAHRHPVVRFSAGPPKIYRYPKLPAGQQDI